MSGRIDLGRVVGRNGEGVADGGTTGQALVKKSGANYDTEWKSVNTLVDGKSVYVDSSAQTKQTVADKLTELSNAVSNTIKNSEIDALFPEET